MKILVITYFIIGIVFSTIAQNLVPNGNFEAYKKCPNHFFLSDYLYDWYSPTKGTPDYFNECSRNKYSVPKNFAGISPAHSGRGYVGLILADNELIYKSKLEKTYSYEFNDREILGVRLNESLIRNEIYCVNFYIKLSSKSLYKINQIDVFFSERKKRFKNIHSYEFIPQLKFNDTDFNKCFEWIMLCATYKPKSNKKYMLLGNFQKTTELNIKKIRDVNVNNNELSNAYYYIDDVSLFPISDSSQCKCNQKQQQESPESPGLHLSDSLSLDSIEINEPVVLNNIYFKLDKAELLPSSYNELNRLLGFLRENPEMEIEIAGHTDSTGSDAYNKKLSRARAKAVVSYLVEKGIDSTRLSHEGYGSSRPVADNQTQEGRAGNRRVEFIIKKK